MQCGHRALCWVLLALMSSACSAILEGADPNGDPQDGDGGFVFADSGAVMPLGDATVPPLVDTLPPPVDQGAPDLVPPDDATLPSVNCQPIADRAGWELCQTTADTCAGVFTDGAGCVAFCAEAGLVCKAQLGGEPGCNKESQNVLACGVSGHLSDWCECGRDTGTTPPPPPPTGDCAPLAGQTPVKRELGLGAMSFTQRNNWVVQCRDYAYSARYDEHMACDSSYNPDGTGKGTATLAFDNVPRGKYQVYVAGRPTENRNPAGALFLVNGVKKVIMQRTSDNNTTIRWDLHGTHCLEGRVEIVLDSSVNTGSDSYSGARLVPVL